MKSSNELLKQALEVANGDPGRALLLLEQALAEARGIDDREAVHALARNAGLICANTGDVRRGVGFLEEATSARPNDAHTMFALGDAHRQLGDLEHAARAFARSRELARSSGDHDMEGMASAALHAIDERRSAE